ncbi:MAG: nucleotide exchange factor GrpE [Holophagae bacterium]|jgi:molecular chaperone GrpE
MHDDKDFPLDADNFSDEVEIEFVDPDEDGAPIENEHPQEGADGISPVVGEQNGEVENLRAELEHVRDVYLRKLAEFDNFRKRVEREREESRRSGAEHVIAQILPVLDNFDRALFHANDDVGAFKEGVEMIARQLYDILEGCGVREVNPEGKPFDPEVHEAVQRVEESGLEPGTVAFVMLKGYAIGDKLIRPAMVGVAVDGSDNGGAEDMS